MFLPKIVGAPRYLAAWVMTSPQQIELASALYLHWINAGQYVPHLQVIETKSGIGAVADGTDQLLRALNPSFKIL